MKKSSCDLLNLHRFCRISSVIVINNCNCVTTVNPTLYCRWRRAKHCSRFLRAQLYFRSSEGRFIKTPFVVYSHPRILRETADMSRIRPTSLSKVLVALTGSLSMTYTGYIEYRKNVMPIETGIKVFGLGTADDLLMDNLSSGDVVLFSRRWYNYHLPAAVFIKLYQYIHDTEYDHCGVIICDDSGVPSIYELSLHGRLTISPFSDRIIRSRAHQIVLIPILPRTSFSSIERNKLADYAKDQLKSSGAYPECISLGLGLLYSGFMAIFGDEVAPKFISQFIGRSFECPNAQVVLDCWRQLNIDLKDESLRQKLTCINLLNGGSDVELSYHKPGNYEVLSLGGNIIIRTH